MKENHKLDSSEIRNIVLPLAVTKPNLYEKLTVVTLVTFYLMILISYFTDGFLTQYIFLELGLIALLIVIVSAIYDFVYRNAVEAVIDSELAGVVIGFSNKLLILTGEEVMDEIETDEIKIRSVNDEEEETFFSKYTSVIDCFKDGELVSKIGVDRVIDFEGAVLKADMSRVNEDIIVVYDDENIDDDMTDSDDSDGVIDDLEDLSDLIDEVGEDESDDKN